MKKCPGCGQPIESFATRCPYCGMEIHSDGAASSLVKFTEKLDELEGKRNPTFGTKEEKKKIGCMTILMWYIFFPILGTYYLIKAAMSSYSDPNFDGVDKRKQDYIMNAPVPNNREDLIEFLILCSNRIESINYLQLFKKKSAEMTAWNSVWGKKINMLGEKAKISMKDDKSSLQEVERILAEANAKIAANKKRSTIILSIIGGIFALILLLCFISSLFSQSN